MGEQSLLPSKRARLSVSDSDSEEEEEHQSRPTSVPKKIRTSAADSTTTPGPVNIMGERSAPRDTTTENARAAESNHRGAGAPPTTRRVIMDIKPTLNVVMGKCLSCHKQTRVFPCKLCGNGSFCTRQCIEKNYRQHSKQCTDTVIALAKVDREVMKTALNFVVQSNHLHENIMDLLAKIVAEDYRQ